MQTCSRCNASSPDPAPACINCGVDLGEFSVSALTLREYQKNSRVSFIRINAAGDACPLCYESRGEFKKDEVPQLPHQGCSHALGCRCTYEPVLIEIYP